MQAQGGANRIGSSESRRSMKSRFSKPARSVSGGYGTNTDFDELSREALKVNGIPDWENPMAEKPPTTKSLTLSPKKSSPRLKRNVDRESSGNHRPTQLVRSQPRQAIPPQLENLMIECDESTETSYGDITYDGSIANDDEFFATQRNYRQPATVSPSAHTHGPRSRVQNYSRSCPRPPVAPQRQPSLQRCAAQIVPDDRNVRNHTVEEDLTVEEEEQRLIQLAMERSLHDNSNGSCSVTSMSYQSNLSDTSYRTHGSSLSASNLVAAGCHLSMMSDRSRQARGNTTSLEPPKTLGQAGKGFVWARKGKKWLKVPADASAAELHAIAESDERLHESFLTSGSGSDDIGCSQDYADGARLEQMEDRMVFEAMNRSMVVENEIDPEVALARLRELEQEKAMLENGLRRSVGVNRTLSNESLGSRYSGASGSSRRSAYSRTVSHSSGLHEAGCHLAMVGSSSRRSKNRDPGRFVPRSRSFETARVPSASPNDNLVWKRGPNGAWGRFPTDTFTTHDSNEDDMVAEALKRSLRDM